MNHIYACIYKGETNIYDSEAGQRENISSYEGYEFSRCWRQPAMESQGALNKVSLNLDLLPEPEYGKNFCLQRVAAATETGAHMKMNLRDRGMTRNWTN